MGQQIENPPIAKTEGETISHLNNLFSILRLNSPHPTPTIATYVQIISEF